MKPCPYCAEEIQDAAVKCRFCGEWIGEIQERNTEDKEDIGVLSNENSIEVIDAQFSRRPKWGWGWILLVFLLLASFQELTKYNNNPISFFIMIFSPLLLPAFYFVYRRKLLEKNRDLIKTWYLSFKAGFVTYLIGLVLIFIAIYFGVNVNKKLP